MKQMVILFMGMISVVVIMEISILMDLLSSILKMLILINGFGQKIEGLKYLKQDLS